MPDKKSHNKVGLILIGLVILFTASILISSYHQNQAAAISEQAYAPTDSSEQDSLSSDRVNFARLKAFVNASKNAPVDTLP
ncbi:hypothetical protein KW803_03045, partial [Candidatus Saccharibacteria bacterium]|nr:hypothetical protein [Candidatus Saccharibacteria bacterium]